MSDFLWTFCGEGEIFLVVSMAYDRYVSICKPLHYSSIMNRQMYIGFVVTSWIIGFVHSISQLTMIIKLPFCGPRELASFFCDIPLVTKLACMDTYILEMWINADSGVLATICFILLLISYSYSVYHLSLLLNVFGHSRLSPPALPTSQWYCSSLGLAFLLPVATQHHLGGQISGCVLCSHHTSPKSGHLCSKEQRNQKCH